MSQLEESGHKLEASPMELHKRTIDQIT